MQFDSRFHDSPPRLGLLFGPLLQGVGARHQILVARCRASIIWLALIFDIQTCTVNLCECPPRHRAAGGLHLEPISHPRHKRDRKAKSASTVISFDQLQPYGRCFLASLIGAHAAGRFASISDADEIAAHMFPKPLGLFAQGANIARRTFTQF